MGPARRRFPDAVAAAWLSPPPSLAFSLSGGTFEVSPHRTILCAKAGLYPESLRDGPPELLGLLWPSFVRVRSRGALARRGLPRALPHRYARGATSRNPLSPVGPRSRAPPRRRGSPHAGGDPARRCAAAHPSRYSRAVATCVATGGSAEPRARIAARHQSAGLVSRWIPARNPPAAAEPPLPFVRWVPRPTSPARVHSRGVAPSSADRCHPIRSFRPRGSIPTSTVSSARRLPGCCTWCRTGSLRVSVATRPPTSRRFPGRGR